MSGREEGYYGPSESDLGCGAVALVAFLALGVTLVAVLCFATFGDGGSGEPASGDGGGTGGLALDVTDEWAMHRAGLPTKADVVEWHMYGRWAYYEAADGVQEVHIWEDLPGGSAVWDALYGLDHESKAYKFV